MEDRTVTIKLTGGKLPCGHPVECECQLYVGDDERACGWCHEVASLRAANSHLRDCLNKTAIIIEGGNVTLKCPVVGLLEIRSGKVNVGSADADPKQTAECRNSNNGRPL